MKFKDGVDAAEMERTHGKARTRGRKKFPQLDNVEVREVESGRTVEEAIAAYEATGLVEYAEPDYLVFASAVPNDPLYASGYLWQHDNNGQSAGKVDADMDSREAWDVRSASTAIVAVIDTGIRITHEDLAANLWRNPGEIAGNGVDDDRNGYIDDVHGINAITGSGNPSDDAGHGTHVAGTIAAVGNNSRGVTGVAWSAKLMALKTLGADGSGYSSDAVEAIEYARARGATVINLSWGGPGSSQAIYDALNRCRAAGIIIVAAAGNEAVNNDVTPNYPANYALDNLVSVAATTRTDALASYSNYGATAVDLGAPGDQIASTYHTGDASYAYMSGTSMATPQVAGVVALLRTHYPSDSYLQILNRVMSTVDPLPALNGRTRTGGRVNLQKALGAATPPPTSPPAPPSGAVAKTVSSSSISLSWTDASSNETGFEIERRTEAGTFARVGTVGANVASYTDSGLTASTLYYYRVRAMQGSTASAYSNVVSAQTAAPALVAPAAPSGLSATAASTAAISLKWTDASTNETGFEIDRAAGGTTSFVRIANVPTNAISYSDSGLSAGTTYSYRVRALQNTAASAYSNVASATTPAAVATAPATGSWQSRDIGVVATAGRTTSSGSTYTVSGSGADIWNAADEFQFHYQPLAGDGEIVARITALDNTDGWAKAGVMMRASLDANAPNLFAFVTPSFLIGMQQRTTAGGTSTLATSYYGWPPAWVKLVRAGNVFSRFYSQNGTAWTAAGTATVTMPATIYVGLAVTSHRDGTLANATFDQVAISGGTTAPTTPPSTLAAPSGLTANALSASSVSLTWGDNSADETGFEIERATGGATFARVRTVGANVKSVTDDGLAAGTNYTYRVRATTTTTTSDYSNTISVATPATTTAPTSPAVGASWNFGDIGSVGVRGSAPVIEGSTLTVKGGGGDIWGTADGFYLTWKTLRGDGQIVARVESMEDTDAWAKAGVTIRETTAANARHAFVYQTLRNGAGMHQRSTAGGSTANFAGAWWASPPHWVKLVREGSTFSGYTSDDGVAWTLVSTQTLALGTDVLIGLAVSSHNSTRTNTVRFTNVQITAP